MDFKNRHPLNAINGYENLSMLEALIPFVDYSLKLPLALFIKFSEMRLIINCFRSIDNLTRLGLHNPCNDPLDMICSFTGISPDMLKMLFSMMDNDNSSVFSDLFKGTSEMNSCASDCNTSNSKTKNPNVTFGFSPEDISNAMNMFQTMQSGFEESKNNTPTQDYKDEYYNDHSSYSHSDDFEQNIQNMFAEYDLEQAVKFDTNHNDTVYYETHSNAP